jgi:hypothetical protein
VFGSIVYIYLTVVLSLVLEIIVDNNYLLLR